MPFHVATPHQCDAARNILAFQSLQCITGGVSCKAPAQSQPSTLHPEPAERTGKPLGMKPGTLGGTAKGIR